MKEGYWMVLRVFESTSGTGRVCLYRSWAESAIYNSTVFSSINLSLDTKRIHCFLPQVTQAKCMLMFWGNFLALKMS